jgi:hypothetical protein
VGVQAGGGGGMLQVATGGRRAAARVLQVVAVASADCEQWRGVRCIFEAESTVE